MTRNQKVLRTLNTQTIEIDIEDLLKGLNVGCDAQEISNITGIARSNVSRELNDLVREGKVIKINGRPVKFIDRKALERLIKVKANGNYIFENVLRI